MTEKVRLLTLHWSATPKWRWIPNWDRTWRDHITGWRFRVIKWGWWALTVRRDRKETGR